jgi:hypothetical protein
MRLSRGLRQPRGPWCQSQCRGSWCQCRCRGSWCQCRCRGSWCQRRCRRAQRARPTLPRPFCGEPRWSSRRAGANAVDAAGNPFSFNQTPAQALTSMNCTVSVLPTRSAPGLRRRQLGDGCTWANGAPRAYSSTPPSWRRTDSRCTTRWWSTRAPRFVGQGHRRSRRVRRSSPVGFNGNALAVPGRDAGELHRRLRELADPRPRSATRPTFTGGLAPRSPAAR